MKKNLNTLINTHTQYYPWVLISLSALFLIYKYILQVSPSVMTHNLMAFFNIGGAALGNLAATFFYTYMIFQLMAGPIIDRYSPKWITIGAILLCALGALVFSMTHELVYAMLGRAMIGVGAAFATVSYLKITAMWFRPNQFAFVSGLLATAAMVGAIFGEAPLAALVTTIGWRHAMLCCAILGIVIAVFFLFIAKDHSSKNVTAISTMESLKWHNIATVLSSKTNWILTFYSGLAFTPVTVLGGLWGPAFLEEAYSISRTQAASLISLIFFGLAFGGPLFGFLSDRLEKRFPLMLFGTGMSLICILLVLYVTLKSILFLGVLLFLFGLGIGAFMLCFAIAKEMNLAVVTGTVIALINTGDGIFGSFTEPLSGKLLDLLWTGQIKEGMHVFSVYEYRVALSLLPLYLLIAVVLLFFIPEKNR